MKSRLKKLAEEAKSSVEEMVTTPQDVPVSQPPINPNVVNPMKAQIDQISDKGRSILKDIEEYKFFIEQMARAMKNNQFLAQMVSDKKNILEEASQKIYDIVFEMENMDVMKIYENPMMGMPNEEQVDDSSDVEKDKDKPQAKEEEKVEKTTKDEDKKEDGDTPKENIKSPSKNVNSPNDLIDVDGKDPLMNDIEDERENKEENSSPKKDGAPNIKDLLPKQPTVQPQSKP